MAPSTINVPAPLSTMDEPPTSYPPYLPKMLPRLSKSKPHFPPLVPSPSFPPVPGEVVAPSVASTSTSALPLQMLVVEPSWYDSLPPIAPSRSEWTVHPPLVIWPSVDRIVLPYDVSGLQNINYARVLLGATIAPADFKWACTSFEDVTNRCYGSRYEVPKFLSTTLLVNVRQFPLMFLIYYANVWTEVALFWQVRRI